MTRDDSLISSDIESQRPGVVKVAIAAAFCAVALNLYHALSSPLGGVLGAIILLVAAMGMGRGRIWAAYGLSLMQGVSGIAAFTVLLQVSEMERVVGLVVVCSLTLLYFLAGRALARSGGKRGMGAAWIAVACLTTIPLFFVRAYVIPTGSMEDTLLAGDHVFVRVFPHAVLKRGDLAVFRFPFDKKETSVKRVIGMPGDRMRIVANVVYVNGAVLREPYVVHKMRDQNEFRDNLPQPDERAEEVLANPSLKEGGRDMLLHHVVNGEVVVPTGQYLMLGDNRDNSLDGRYFGFVDEADVTGKPFLIYDSDEASTEYLASASVPRMPKMPKVRWERMFRVL